VCNDCHHAPRIPQRCASTESTLALCNPPVLAVGQSPVIPVHKCFAGGLSQRT
jgi:hypothetical protein